METTRLLLERCQRKVEDLERQLRSAKSHHASLTRELQRYSSESWQASDEYQVARHKISLYDLPDELLCEIFEYATLLCHPFIRSVLLVCKRFHRIIMSTSSLWTRIDLRFPKDLMDSFFPTKEYVETCLERSRGRLLDITIEFPRYITTTNYALDQVVVKMTPILGGDASMDLQETLVGVDWQCDSSLVEERVTHLETVAKSLIGSNGEYMLRWRSLSMILSEDEWGNFFLARMQDYPAPDLQRLEIMNMRFMEDWFEDGDCSFPTMPQLRSLKTERLCLHWLDPAPATLTHLDTAYKLGLLFDHLSGLQQLRHLCIRDATSESLYQKDPVTLPHLSKLYIYGNIDGTLASLVTPKLEVLFVCSSQTMVKKLLPNVPLIEWEWSLDGSKPEGIFSSQRDALGSIFSKMRETRRLYLQGFKAGMIDEIEKKKNRRNGGLPASLQVIEILVGGVRETIVTRTS